MTSKQRVANVPIDRDDPRVLPGIPIPAQNAREGQEVMDCLQMLAERLYVHPRMQAVWLSYANTLVEPGDVEESYNRFVEAINAVLRKWKLDSTYIMVQLLSEHVRRLREREEGMPLVFLNFLEPTNGPALQQETLTMLRQAIDDIALRLSDPRLATCTWVDHIITINEIESSVAGQISLIRETIRGSSLKKGKSSRKSIAKAKASLLYETRVDRRPFAEVASKLFPDQAPEDASRSAYRWMQDLRRLLLIPRVTGERE